MEYRRLGRTSEKVSVIGMGSWRVGSYGSQGERAEQVRAIRRGIELGINLIDTAEMYGDGRSESLIGEAIEGRRDSVFIATKVWPNHLHHDDVMAACDRSLQRLGVHDVDLYQVHWPNPSVPVRETMAAMEELVRAGKVRYLGVSNFSVQQVDEARGALARSELVSNQVEYSITNRSAEREILPHCRKEHITLIAYSPLARGAIPESRIPAALRRKYMMTPAQVMLNWATRFEEVVAIPKAARVGHVEENAASASVRFTQSEYDQI
ncbi:MAG TPA: aldo/keto reductase [Nitrososphaerales archaeon]|nr:aldo/keto reductase [Nitrososphaerales archaeon]